MINVNSIRPAVTGDWKLLKLGFGLPAETWGQRPYSSWCQHFNEIALKSSRKTLFNCNRYIVNHCKCSKKEKSEIHHQMLDGTNSKFSWQLWVFSGRYFNGRLRSSQELTQLEAMLETGQVSAGVWMELLSAKSSADLRGLLFSSQYSPSERISTPTSPLLLLRLAPPPLESCLHGGAPPVPPREPI